PAVTTTAETIPWLSVTRCALVLKPPRERPNAWSSGSVTCAAAGPPNRGGGPGFLFRPGGRDVGAADGCIDAPQLAGDGAGPVQSQPQGVEDAGPSAVLAPAVEAIIDGLPGAVALGGVRPRGAGVQVPEDPIDQRPMVLPRVAGLAVVVAIGEEGCDPLPLGV